MSFATTAAVIGSAAAAKSLLDPGTGKQTVSQTIDPAQMALYEDLYGRAKGIAAQPFVPYTGLRVAGFSPDQLRAFEATRGLFETGMQYDPLTDIRGIAEAPIPSLLSTDISAYQSPFQQQVIDTTMADIQRQADIARQKAQDVAIGAGAFGGSRSAILEAESQRPFADVMARTAAGLRQTGFEQAQRAAESDIARQLAGREFRAGLLGGISAEQQRRLGMLGGIGTQQQALQQRALDIPYQEFQRALAYPQQQLGLLAQGVSAQPQLTGKTSAYQPSSLEGVTSALNILSQPFMQNLFSTGGSGSGSGGSPFQYNPGSPGRA